MNEPGRIRLFVAAEIPPSARGALGLLQATLRERMADSGALRWVTPDRIHLTLKFLGNVEVIRVPELAIAMANAVRGQPVFDLAVGAIGVFPNAHAPKVLWAGLTGDLDALTLLRDRTEAALVGVGFLAEERPFRAHLTLARVPNGVRPHELTEVTGTGAESANDTLTRFSVERVALVHSVLGEEGPAYRSLATADLV